MGVMVSFIQGLTESTLVQVENVRLSRKVLYHFAIFVIVPRY